MTARKAVVFCHNGTESEENARQLSVTLSAAGFSPCVVPFFSAPGGAERPEGWHRASLLGDTIGSAPRVSAFAFRSALGFDLDLLDLAAHNLAVDGARADQVLLESEWYQHLRGVAQVTNEFLLNLRPQVVLVPQGAELVSRIVSEVCRRNDMKLLYWESAFFSGYHCVDPLAPHFFAGESLLDRNWARRTATPFTSDEAADAAAFIAEWRRTRASKYRQSEDPEELRRCRDWIGRRPGPIVFVPGQVPTDANVAVGLGAFSNLNLMYRKVLSTVPEDWRVIFKQHPMVTRRDPGESSTDRIMYVCSIHVHDILEHVDAVATLSSNVGLESLLYGTPVVLWGRPIYGGKGLTRDVACLRQLNTVLRNKDFCAPPPLAVKEFVHHLTKGLVRLGDGAHLAHLIDGARGAPNGRRLPFYGSRVKAIAQAARRLNQGLSENRTLAAAIARLKGRERKVLFRHAGRQELLRHAFGGPIAPCRVDRLCPHLDLAGLFREAVGINVSDPDTNLIDVHSPGLELSRLLNEATPHGAVLLVLPGRETCPHTAIQRLAAEDVTSLLHRGRSAWSAEFFGLDGNRVFDRPEGRPYFLALLRQTRPPLSAGERRAVLRRAVAMRPWMIPSGSFTMRRDDQGDWDQRSHEIYGPYIPIPPGRWSATFLFRDQDSPRRHRCMSPVATSTDRRHMSIDVHSTSAGVVASQDVYLPPDRIAPQLTFAAAGRGLYEFRVFAHRRSGYWRSFQGVVLQWLRPVT